jgi:hypothetical protein
MREPVLFFLHAGKLKGTGREEKKEVGKMGGWDKSMRELNGTDRWVCGFR